jgi:hypothetical protein
MRERQSWLPMEKMKGKVPRERARPTRLSGWRFSVKLAGRKSADEWAEDREINVSRVRRFLPWVLGVLAASPLAPAFGQNLDAGKPASQIFAEVCANCHRSPRDFKSNPGASFLREHYTTGSEMASTMAAYLSAGADPRGPGPQPKRQPAATPSAGTAAARDVPSPSAEPASREPRRAQQTPEPKALPQPGSTRLRPASARADASKPDTTAEMKPVQPPAPTRPVLEEFEE